MKRDNGRTAEIARVYPRNFCPRNGRRNGTAEQQNNGVAEDKYCFSKPPHLDPHTNPQRIGVGARKRGALRSLPVRVRTQTGAHGISHKV